jgi:hypothetical protein
MRVLRTTMDRVHHCIILGVPGHDGFGGGALLYHVWQVN